MSSLANRHVLVTGGAGFLGRRVVALLEATGAVVTAPRSSEFDLTVPGAADRMLAEFQPTEIVHLAAQVGGIGYNLAQPAPLY
ncbi:MAG: GDP-L-fucose synthase, partial [Ilumatobacter sp.]